MATSIRIEINDAEVRRAIDGLISAAVNLQPALDEIGTMLVAATQQRFERGEAPDGARWPESIRAREEGGQTLIDRGHLRDSITHRASAEEVEVGTNVLYAATHQFGATIRARNARHLKFRLGDRFVSKTEVTIPARPFIGISADDRAEIAEILIDHLREALP